MYASISGKQTLLALAFATPVLLTGCGGSGESTNSSPAPVSGSVVAGDSAVASPTPTLKEVRESNVEPSSENDQVHTDSVCSGESPLELIGTFPFPGEQGMPTNSSLVFIFNAIIDPSSIDSSTFTMGGNNSYDYDIRVAGNQVVIDPNQDFDPNQDYLATMQGLFADCSEGQAFFDDIGELPFGTGAGPDNSPLQITTVYPTSGDDLIDPREPITLHFSGALDPTSVSGGALYIRQLSNPDKAIGGSVQFDASNQEMTFFPSESMDPQTAYELIAGQGLSGLTDNPLAEQFESLFRTGGDLGLMDSFSMDQVAGLGDRLQTLAAQLQEQFGGFDGGSGDFQNPLLLTLPLVGSVDESSFGVPDQTDTLIAICDPAATTSACALALDIDVDPSGMEQLMTAFETQDPNEAATLVMALLGQLADPSSVSAPFSASVLLAEPGFSNLFPAPMSDGVKLAVEQIAAGLNQLPVVADLLGDVSSDPLLQVGLFQNGSLLTIAGTDLVNVLSMPELTAGQTPSGDLPALTDLQTMLTDGGQSLPVLGSYLTGDVPGGLVSGGSFDDLLNLASMDPNPQIQQVLGNQAVPTNFTDIPVLGDILETVITELLDLFF